MFFFKQKTAYEMRISDWSSDVCASDLAATDQPTAEADVTPAAAENPLLTASTLPFQAPPFDKIEDADFLPAFEEDMKQHLAEVRKTADNPEPATLDNTIVAIEQRGEPLGRVARTYFGMVQADNNTARQKNKEETDTKQARHREQINTPTQPFDT